jgi:hypothetical protein
VAHLLDLPLALAGLLWYIFFLMLAQKTNTIRQAQQLSFIYTKKVETVENIFYKN